MTVLQEQMPHSGKTPGCLTFAALASVWMRQDSPMLAHVADQGQSQLSCDS